MKIEILKLGYLATNCYLVSKNNSVIIIDPADDSDLIIDACKKYSVKGILVTHHHPDHIGALNDLENYYGIKHNKKIDDFDYEIIETPGHTDDSISFYFPKEKAIFCGDFLFKNGIGRYDFVNSNYKDMLNSLEIIKKYPDDIALYPGHDEITNLGEEKKHFLLY